MSRGSAGDTVTVKPTSNIYTVLSAVAVVCLLLALICVWTQGNALFNGLLSQQQGSSNVRR